MDPRTTSPSWSPGKRVLFRFAFCYLVLYKLPFPLNLTAWSRDFLAKPYQDLWDGLVPWVGKHLLGLSIRIQTSGSGDKTYNYVQLLCFLIIAVAVTVVWTALDRKRTEYTRLYEGLRTYIRFALAAAMLLYGAYKVIPSQFAKPFPSQLIEPFGESSPMGLLWTFMGASSGYTIFAGAAEMLSGLLLAFRRTALLGALVSIGVMSRVVALNFCYDVPVKLSSSHLLAMGVFLILPDLRRLLNLFVFNRPVEAAAARPPLLTDATRWRRVIFEYDGYISFQLMDGSRSNYGLIMGKRRFALTKLDDETLLSSFSYKEIQPGLLTLDGTMLLGALVSFAALSDIVALNFFYDIHVKLFSSHLLAMAVFLILPDVRRLIDMLVLGRGVEPIEIRPLFRRPGCVAGPWCSAPSSSSPSQRTC